MRIPLRLVDGDFCSAGASTEDIGNDQATTNNVTGTGDGRGNIVTVSQRDQAGSGEQKVSRR